MPFSFTFLRHPAWISTGVTATATLLFDQLVKWFMLAVVDIAARQEMTVTPFFKLVMVWNYGISFGMLAHPGTYVPWFLKGVALMIAGVVAYLAIRSHSALERVAYGLIIGGALGNVIDRVRFGAVADFFSFHIGEYAWPAFNIADAAIFCGVMLLIWLGLRARKAA
jgi:signal peptidase II